jgi:hypothetical protein
LASTDPTAPAVTGQAVTVTALCEAGRCHLCPGRIVSATPAHGQPCGHACHGLDDLAVEARLEVEHFGEVA